MLYLLYLITAFQIFQLMESKLKNKMFFKISNNINKFHFFLLKNHLKLDNNHIIIDLD